MNRQDFLDKLFEMYPTSFTKENKQSWWDAYKAVLSESIDYDQLYQTFLTEWSSNTKPMPAWLKEKSIRKQSEVKQDEFAYSGTVRVKVKGTVFAFAYNPHEMNYNQAKEVVYRKVKGKEYQFIEQLAGEI